MLIMAVTGIMPSAAAWSTNEEERRKALLAYFLAGVPYILWDNIARGSQISCPHIEKSCTSAYYADRVLGVSEVVNTAAATIHLLHRQQYRGKGRSGLAHRLTSASIVDRADPENREVRAPDPRLDREPSRRDTGGALHHPAGQPAARRSDAAGKTRFKMWWRLVGSAVENAAKLTGNELDFQQVFIDAGRGRRGIGLARRHARSTR